MSVLLDVNTNRQAYVLGRMATGLSAERFAAKIGMRVGSYIAYERGSRALNDVSWYKVQTGLHTHGVDMKPNHTGLSAPYMHIFPTVPFNTVLSTFTVGSLIEIRQKLGISKQNLSLLSGVAPNLIHLFEQNGTMQTIKKALIIRGLYALGAGWSHTGPYVANYPANPVPPAPTHVPPPIPIQVLPPPLYSVPTVETLRHLLNHSKRTMARRLGMVHEEYNEYLNGQTLLNRYGQQYIRQSIHNQNLYIHAGTLYSNLYDTPLHQLLAYFTLDWLKTYRQTAFIKPISTATLLDLMHPYTEQPSVSTVEKWCNGNADHLSDRVKLQILHGLAYTDIKVEHNALVYPSKAPFPEAYKRPRQPQPTPKTAQMELD